MNSRLAIRFIITWVNRTPYQLTLLADTHSLTKSSSITPAELLTNWLSATLTKVRLIDPIAPPPRAARLPLNTPPLSDALNTGGVNAALSLLLSETRRRAAAGPLLPMNREPDEVKLQVAKPPPEQATASAEEMETLAAKAFSAAEKVAGPAFPVNELFVTDTLDESPDRLMRAAPAAYCRLVYCTPVPGGTAVFESNEHDLMVTVKEVLPTRVRRPPACSPVLLVKAMPVSCIDDVGGYGRERQVRRGS